MNIKVKLYGHLPDIAGSREVEMKVEDGSSLKQLLVKLAEKLGCRFKEQLLSEDGRLLPYLMTFVNDTLQASSSIILKDGDVVEVVPKITGG